jgi:hypothetical protein
VVVGTRVVVVGTRVVVVGTRVVVVGTRVVVVGTRNVVVALAKPSPSRGSGVPQPARTNINAKVLNVVRIAAASQLEISLGHVRWRGAGAKPDLAGLSPAASTPS